MRQPLLRRPLLALAGVALLLGACAESPQPTTTVAPPKPSGPPIGSPTTASGKQRIALLLPLSGRAAAIGQSMQQAAELALFESGAKEIALSAYDSGESAEVALQAYQKARTDGVALVLGPLFSNSAAALSSSVRRGGANVIAFSNDESAAQPGVFIMGIAAPPQVRRVVDYALQSGIKRFATFAPRTAYGEQMSRTLESHVSARGGKVVAAELFDEGAPDLTPAAQRLAKEANVEDAAAGKIAVLVPVAPPRSATVLGALNGVGIDKASVQFIGTGDRKSTRLNSSHSQQSRMPSSA